MFYLIRFYRLLFRDLACGLVFVLGTLSFMGTPAIMEMMEKRPIAEDIPSYFFALTRHLPTGGRNRLLRLPGVEEVIVLEQDHIARKKKKIMERFNLKGDLLDMEHTGMKIVFKDGISENVKGLIRHYLKKFMGEENVTMGPVVQEEKKSALWRQWQKGALIVVGGLLCLCWLLSFGRIRKNIQREAWLVGRFQRKEHVAVKMYLAGVLGLTPVASLFFFYTPEPIRGWPFALQGGLLLLLPFFRRTYRWE